jgi:NAD(P)H dehydrogenase (quinone)
VATAVGVLTQDGHANKAYDVTGPELWTLPDAMALISQMAGKPIAVEPVDDEGMYAYFDSLGVPRKASDVMPDGPIPWASEGMVEYFDSLGVPRHASDEPSKSIIPWSSDDMVTFGQSIREGFMDIESNDVERVTGRLPRTLRSVLEQYQHLWPQ